MRRTTSGAQRAVAVVAVIFGLATVVAGMRVLAGGDPGYVVFRPLVIFNTAMGFVYCGAGVLAWTRLRAGRLAATAIFLLNVIVLVAVTVLYRRGAAVAVDSVRAMILRSAVWLVLLVTLLWLERIKSRT